MRTALAPCLAVALAAMGCARGEGEPSPSPATLRIEARVVAADGEAPELAHVHVDVPDAETVTVAAGADGEADVEVPRGELLHLRVSAVDHQEITVPLLLTGDTPDPLPLVVTLAANPFPAEIAEVEVGGDFLARRETVPMARREDGAWTLEVESEASEVKVQLVGLATNGHTVNVPGVGPYEYDGGGDYWSVVPVTGGRATVVFDPAALPARAAADAGPRLATPEPMVLQAFALAAEVEAAHDGYVTALQAGEASAATALDPVRERLAAIVDDDEAPEPLRRYAAIHLLSLPAESAPTEADRAALAHLPAASIFWTVDPWAVVGLDAEVEAELLGRLAEEGPSRDVRAAALYQLAAAARDAGETERWHELYGRLTEGYADTPIMRLASDRLDPEAAVAVGRPVPDFRVALLGGGEASDESLRGSHTLIDFWATWCLPCVAEMPRLHEAWDRWGGDGLDILSVSFDAEEGDVAPFRAEKWPMPWRHAFVEGGMKSDLAKAFDVNGIPKPLLVGPDGVVLATAESLRGPDLLATLEAALGPGSAPATR